MKRDAFDALLKRREELESKHRAACERLEEEGPEYAAWNYRTCARLYDQIQALQEQIDDEIAAERAAE
jgi:hypothetical protein